MTPVDVQRRSLLIAATGIGAGLMVPEALAQHGPSDQNGPEARMIGGIHGDMVNKLSDALKGTRPFSKDNLLELINLLSGKDVGNISLPAVLTPPQSDLVRKVVEAIYSSPDISEVAKKIEAMYKEVSDRTRDLGAAIVSIAHDSVQFAKKHQKAIFIVASDVGGALTGATQAAKLGPYAAGIGALAGAITASYLASTQGASPTPHQP